MFFVCRRRYPASVSCWFCGEKSEIPRDQINSWDCPYCEQYNGFTEVSTGWSDDKLMWLHVTIFLFERNQSQGISCLLHHSQSSHHLSSSVDVFKIILCSIFHSHMSGLKSYSHLSKFIDNCPSA